MKRLAAALVLSLFASSVVLADIAVPPPAGKKFVPVTHTITTDKSFPEYEFYLQIGFGTPEKVAFGPDKAVTIRSNRGGLASRAVFAAVPTGAAGKYADEKAFAADFRTNKVPGMVAAKRAFDPRALVDVKDARKDITETHAVEKIDAKGLVFKTPAPTGTPPSKGAGGEEELEAVETGYAPRGGTVIAGLAIALAVAFTGLWLARRPRA